MKMGIQHIDSEYTKLKSVDILGVLKKTKENLKICGFRWICGYYVS